MSEMITDPAVVQSAQYLLDVVVVPKLRPQYAGFKVSTVEKIASLDIIIHFEGQEKTLRVRGGDAFHILQAKAS